MHRDSVAGARGPARWGAWSAALLWLVSAPGSAQPASPADVADEKSVDTVVDVVDGGPGAAAGAVAAAETAVVDVAELLNRIDAWRQTTAELSKALEEDRPFEALSSQVQDTQERLDEALHELETTMAGTPNLRQLEELAIEWQDRATDLKVQKQRIADALERASTRLSTLVTLIQTARQTVEEWPSEVADELLRARAATALAQMDVLRERQTYQQRDLTRLQVLHDQQEVRASAALDTVVAAKQAEASGLLERTEPALWNVLDSLTFDVSAMEQRRRMLMARIGDTLDRRQSAMAWQVVLLLLLWTGLVRAQERGEHVWVPPRDVRMVKAVLRRPRAAALLLVIACTPLLARGGPLLLGYLLLLPALALAVALVASVRSQPLPLAIGFPFVTLAADMVRELNENPAFGRALLVVELLFFAGATLNLSMGDRARDLSPLRNRATFRRALRVLAGVATLVALLTLFGFQRLGSLVGNGILKSTYLTIAFGVAYVVGVGAGAVLLTSKAASRIAAVRKRPEAVFSRARIVAGLAMLAAWTMTVLSVFSLREGAVAFLEEMWSVQYTLGTVTVSPADLLGFVLVLVVSFELATGVHHLLADDVLPHLSLPRGVPFAIATMARYALVATGFIIAVGAAGIEMSRLTVVFGALGVGIGFGMQTIVNNFMSGLILLFERPVQVGDVVEVAGVIGSVQRIGIRSSTVRTFQGAEVLVPNAEFMSQNVTNWTLSDKRRRIEIDVPVALGSNPDEVIQVLVAGLNAHEDVLDDPAPIVLFTHFGEGTLGFQMRCWVSGARDWVAIDSELHVLANRLLKEAGIRVPVPPREVQLTSPPPSPVADEAQDPGTVATAPMSEK